MKTTANISRPSYSQQAMRRHRAGVAPGAPACAGGAGGGGGVGGGGGGDIRATGERLGSYWGYRPGRSGLSAEAEPPNGGSAVGTATGTPPGVVSTPVDAAPGSSGYCAAWPGAGSAIGVTGAATRGEWSMTGGILGAFGRPGWACSAAGTWASFLGETGRRAVAAPRGLGAARAASARRCSSDRAW